jgi:PLP dependent protein
VTIEADLVAGRLADVRERLERAGAREVEIVAVTKGFGADAIRAAVAAGLDRVGENYAQELVAKHAEVAELLVGRRVRVHFIGRLQTNKVRQLVGRVDCVETVDRLGLVDELSRRCPGLTVLVQVNATGEPDKGGCPPGEAAELVDRARAAGLVVEGLMAVGPTTGPPEASGPAFRAVRGLVDELGLAVCSMGMSDDLEVAVAEGSTRVRVGSALFGARPPA